MSHQHHALLRASARLLAVLAFFGLMLVMNQPTASAQCMPNNCVNVRVFNCTIPPTVYQVKFFLCCGGVTMVSPTIVVPPAPCTTPAIVYTAPAGCTVIGLAGISPTPIAGWIFTPGNCTLRIN